MTAYYYMVQKHRAYNHYNFFGINNGRFEYLFGACDYDKLSPWKVFTDFVSEHRPEYGITKENAIKTFGEDYILQEIKFKK